MLETYSPIPMLEGEQIIGGISSKHVLHFVIGAAVSAPFTGTAIWVFPLFGLPKFAAAFIAVGLGVLFAVLPVQKRPLAEVLWLSVRLMMRPKVVLYDRQYRIRTHRQEEKG